jgi:formate/nitrite transporter FocA (FNT family)
VENLQPTSQMATVAVLAGIIVGGCFFVVIGYLAIYRRIKNGFAKP